MPPCRDSLEKIGYCYNPGAYRDLVALQSIRIPGTVDSFMMGAGYFGNGS